jgi:hypothetical protein
MRCVSAHFITLRFHSAYPEPSVDDQSQVTSLETRITYIYYEWRNAHGIHAQEIAYRFPTAFHISSVPASGKLFYVKKEEKGDVS